MKIQLKFLLLIIVFPFNRLLAQMPDTINNQLNKQLSLFADSANSISIGNGKYNVFVVRMEQGEDSNHFCLSVSYIVNDFELKYINHDYFLNLEGKYFLINNYLKSNNILDIKKTDEQSLKIVKEKLRRKMDGPISNNPIGMFMCMYGDSSRVKYYQNAHDIPSIYFDK